MLRMSKLTASRPRDAWSPETRAEVLSVALSSLVGLYVGAWLAQKPTLAVLPLAALATILLLVDGRVRLAFVLFGGLFALQSSEALSPLKVAYLGGVFVAFGGALLDLRRKRDPAAYLLSLPLLRVSIAFLVVVLISYPVATANGVRTSDWLRDIAPYALFAAAPIFALDAQSWLSRRALISLLVASGVVATASYAVVWLQKRSIAELPLTRLALVSTLLPAALFAYSIAAALQRTSVTGRWTLLASSVVGSMFVTGSRASLSLLAAPLASVVGARRNLTARSLRFIVLVPVCAVLIGAVAYSVLITTDASTATLRERIETLQLNGNLDTDYSYNERIEQSNAAWSVFRDHPIFGSGPGTYFEWETTTGAPVRAYVLDTPLAFPAKFGIVGLVAIIVLLFGYGSFFRSMGRWGHPRAETLALIGFAAAVLVWSGFAPPFEDKGFSLGLMLLVALVLATARGGESDRPSSDGPSAPRRAG